jgi:hypothetical protein
MTATRDWVICCGSSWYGKSGKFVTDEREAKGFPSAYEAQDFATGMRCAWSVRERSPEASTLPPRAPAGTLEVGASCGEVIINLPYTPDGGTGFVHYAFTPDQARGFALSLLRKADEATVFAPGYERQEQQRIARERDALTIAVQGLEQIDRDAGYGVATNVLIAVHKALQADAGAIRHPTLVDMALSRARSLRETHITNPDHTYIVALADELLLKRNMK